MRKSQLFIISLLCICSLLSAQDIFRFEHFNSTDGLSQNTVTSLLNDSKGYLWIGTMNGLNRYDGYQFKVYKNNIDNPLLTNNRILSLWQDKKKFIWLQTYDNYYHYLNPKTEQFKTLPEYSTHINSKYNHATCFRQQNDDIIWVGTSNGGIYRLFYDKEKDAYNQLHFSDKGRYSISNQKVNFIYTANDSSVWIGTEKGLNLLTNKDIIADSYHFQHLFINLSFSSAIEINDKLWFGSDQGILEYHKTAGTFKLLDTTSIKELLSNNIKHLFVSKQGIVLITLPEIGVIAYNSKTNTWHQIKTHGNDILDVYFDRHNNAWITAKELGLTRLDLDNLQSHFYNLTEKTYQSITDLERHVFYEDKDNNLWIGLHGSGLHHYNYEKDEFNGYFNDIKDPNSLSSNIVHSIIEDNSGIMWLGTGQFKGGMDKVIRNNQAFKHIATVENPEQINDNVVRALKQDANGCIWTGTKSGELHIFDKDYSKIYTFNSFSGQIDNPENINIYSIYIDNEQYIWLGSKGEGLLVSTSPLPKSPTQYKNLKFKQYKHIENDTTSLCSNKIYSITKGSNNDIWIGTFENGISKVNIDKNRELTFINYNTNNSNLSNDLVRYLMFDSNSNLWVATSFGLNLLPADSIKNDKINFKTLYHSPNIKTSISYNDIVIIKEDSQNKIWFGTFGGGVNNIQLPLSDSLRFNTISSRQGLSNDVVFSIEEDKEGMIWFGSENGLSRYNTIENSIEVFNEYNGLSFNNFSESTSITLNDGRLFFGGFQGIEVITPKLIEQSPAHNNIELTNFQLFNKDVIVGAPKSPLTKNISYTNKIKLLHHQSSFSIEYSALDFRDPNKVQYAYMLDGFDNDWVVVNHQTKATYTNLKPGDYIFKVRCTNNKGQWYATNRELAITITPPWWQTNMAMILYILIAIATYYLITHIIKRINKYRKDLDIEKTVNTLKLKFFTNISHEIRTPLTLILGPIDDLLESDIEDKNVSKQLKIIRKNANRMLQLVNQLLDFRKVQNNKMTLKVESVELNSFTQSIYENFIPLANHKGIFYTYKPHESPIDILADKNQLDSIIYNLISNAIKFTPEGKKVVISVSINTQTNMAQINVIDQGPGIDEKDMSEIFSRYTILSGINQSGTGIGLSLAYELAKLHGGDIELSSVVNQGSSFSLSLPLNTEIVLNLPHIQRKNSEESNAQINHNLEFDIIENAQPSDSKNIKTCPTILVVEDNTEIADYIKSSLKDQYNCLLATNGNEGLRLAKQENPDVILTDIMMPQMDGLEMTQLLKEDFSTCHIPIVMMTAKTDIKDQITGIETGAEAYITKPLNIKYLKAVVNTFNQQRQLIISKFRNNKTIDPKTLKINFKDEEFLQKLVEYIENNYSADLSVEVLSQHCCVSRTVLYNKVKGLTGLSPVEFVRQLKLKIANQLLLKGYSVSEVAYKVGYNDIKYFSKLFKKQYGYPPSKALKLIDADN
nr:two-component regulator propeller domain-containing protein [uncultured Carboxylicivirga sp.]